MITTTTSSPTPARKTWSGYETGCPPHVAPRALLSSGFIWRVAFRQMTKSTETDIGRGLVTATLSALLFASTHTSTLSSPALMRMVAAARTRTCLKGEARKRPGGDVWMERRPSLRRRDSSDQASPFARRMKSSPVDASTQACGGDSRRELEGWERRKGGKKQSS